MYHFVKFLPEPYLIISQQNNQYLILEANNAWIKYNNVKDLNIIGADLFSIVCLLNTDTQYLEQLKNSLSLVSQTLLSQSFTFTKIDAINNQILFAWEITHTPVLAPSGQLEYIIHKLNDITNFVKTKTELTNKKLLISTAETTAQLGTWELDLISNKLTWSDGVFLICEFEPQSFEVTFDIGLSVIHPDDRERAVNIMQNTIKTGEEYFTEKRFLLKNGKLKHIKSCAKLIYNYNGQPIKLIGVFQDITKEKKEEERLKLLESVVTNSSDSVLITEAEPFDETGPKILFVNNAFTQMTGYLPEEVIGKTPGILQGPKTDFAELKRLKNALKNWESCEVTTINYKKNGEEFWVNFKVNPVADQKGWFTHWVAIERDVTAEKRYETHLKDLFNEKNTILESIYDAFFSIDNQGKIIYWNKNAELILGQSANDMLGKNLWETFGYAKSSPFLINYKKAIDEKQTVRFTEFSIFKNRWFDVSAYPSNNGLSVYFRDITDKKNAEIALLNALNEKNSILENFGDGFCTIDNNWNVTYWNPEAEKLTKITKQEILGKCIWDFYGNDKIIKEYLEKAFNNKTAQKFEHFRDNNWITFSIYPYENNLSVYFQDITNKKQLALNLLESEKRYSNLFLLTPLPMCVYDAETFKIIQVNKAAINTYGYSEQEFLQKQVFDLVPENDLENIKDVVNLDFQNQDESYRSIQRHIVKSGEIIEVEIYRRDLTIDNKPHRLVLANNITEKLRQIRAIEAKNKALQDIAWTQSHIVRAPLSRIIGLVTHISEFRNDDEQFQLLLQFLLSSANELDNKIKEIVLKSEKNEGL
jgi:PAS domain S-box-containing protein